MSEEIEAGATHPAIDAESNTAPTIVIVDTEDSGRAWRVELREFEFPLDARRTF